MRELVNSDLVPWKTMDTIRKKVREEGFPAYYDGGRYYFDPEKIERWFKRREVVAS